MGVVIEDILLVAIVVALGAWAFSALRAARSGRVVPPRCPGCGGLVARVDSRCRHCGEPLPGTQAS